MSDSPGIVEFLNARLDEDERTARAATPGSWTPERKGVLDSDGIEFVEAPRRDVSHIARHDPVRVLREVAAKREIIQRYENIVEDSFRDAHVQKDAVHQAIALYGVLQKLAAVYTDHPGYQRVWADERDEDEVEEDLDIARWAYAKTGQPPPTCDHPGCGRPAGHVTDHWPQQ